MKPLYALGIGASTPVFIDLAEACGYTVVGLYYHNATRTGEVCWGIPVVGSFDDLLTRGDLGGMEFMLTMGNQQIRGTLTDELLRRGGRLPSLIHPTAVVSRFATLSDTGMLIDAFVHIQAETVLEDGVVILTGAVISHNCRLGRNVFVAAGVVMGCFTEVGVCAFIGQGALSISNKVTEIGAHSYIGARALLTRSVAPWTVMAGSPARAVRVIAH